MAQKTKTTLMRAAYEKLKVENAKRAKGMKEVKAAGERKVKEKEGKKEGVTKRQKWGICALQEINKYQSGTELLI